MTWAVEVTVPEVINDDWSLLDAVLTMMPGAILIRDRRRPVLVVPVRALNPVHAERAAARVLASLGIGTLAVTALDATGAVPVPA